jgi:hypothetical protein
MLWDAFPAKNGAESPATTPASQFRKNSVIYELVPKLIDCALNAHGFGTSSWKNRQKPGFSTKIKVAVPKTGVLEQPHMKLF